MRACGLVAVLFLCACSGGPGQTCSTPEPIHLSGCDDACCGNGENPPTGGGHCGFPLSCGIHAGAQQRCRWIHNLEHGHLVLAYRCPEGCPEVVTALEEIWRAQPVGLNSVRRAVLTPDPLLPMQVAAVVWGHSWSGEAVDRTAIDAIIARQDGPGTPEADLDCSP